MTTLRKLEQPINNYEVKEQVDYLIICESSVLQAVR